MALSMSAREQKRIERLEKAAANAASPPTKKLGLSDTSMVDTELVSHVKHGIVSKASPDVEMADVEPLAEHNDVNKPIISPFKVMKSPVAPSVATTAADTPMGGTGPDLSFEDLEFIRDTINDGVGFRGEEGSQHVKDLLENPMLCKYIRSDPDILSAVVKRVVFAVGYEEFAKLYKLEWRPRLVQTQLDSVDRGAYARKICDLYYVLTGRKITTDQIDLAKMAAFRAYRTKEGFRTKLEVTIKRMAINKSFAPKKNASGLKKPSLTKQTRTNLKETSNSMKMSEIKETLPTAKTAAGIKAVSTTANALTTNVTASTTESAGSTIKMVMPVTQTAASENQMTFAMRLRL